MIANCLTFAMFALTLTCALIIHVQRRTIVSLCDKLDEVARLGHEAADQRDTALTDAQRKQALIDQYVTDSVELMACMQELEDENERMAARLNRTEAGDVIAELDAWLGSEAQL